MTNQQKSISEIINAPIVKRSVVIAGHASSVSIESPFWEELKQIAKQQNTSINKLVTEIDDARIHAQSVNLSSAIRLYVLDNLK